MHDQVLGRAKADNVLDRLYALVGVFDANGALIDCNSAAEAITGLPREGDAFGDSKSMTRSMARALPVMESTVTLAPHTSAA